MCYGSIDPKHLMRDIDARVKHLSYEQDRTKQAASLRPSPSLLPAWGVIRRTFQVLVAAAAIAVAGCVETSAPPDIPPTTPFPADLRKDAFDSAIAMQIAERCKGILVLNPTAVSEVMVRAQAEGKRRGLSRPSTAEVLVVMGGERAVQDHIFGYVQNRGILVNQPSTWCAAGKRELNEKTGISRYLILLRLSE